MTLGLHLEWKDDPNFGLDDINLFLKDLKHLWRRGSIDELDSLNLSDVLLLISDLAGSCKTESMSDAFGHSSREQETRVLECISSAASNLVSALKESGNFHYCIHPKAMSIVNEVLDQINHKIVPLDDD